MWENIGDPVQKGLALPNWIKEIIARQIQDNQTFGYCDSKGLPATREFLADKTNRKNAIKIQPDDITFFNGLGDAIARLYSLISRDTKVLLPSPTYPAHTGAEKLRIGQNPVTYPLHPENNWQPDPDEIRQIVHENSAISAILIINPDNPTGMVYSREILDEIVTIAKEYDLFIIADEIYENLVYDGEMVRLADVIGEVPGMAMKGISKEIPWPGSRCGWIEYYNKSSDPSFYELCKRLDMCKMTEVCSTTLPQAVIPSILSNSLYQDFLDERKDGLSERMSLLKKRLEHIDGVECSGGQGAFYATLHVSKELKIADFNPDSLPDTGKFLYLKWSDGIQKSPDMHLVYYLLAGTGVCTVPLSGFDSTLPGLRITLLEQNTDRFNHMLDQLIHGLEMVFNPEKSLIQQL